MLGGGKDPSNYMIQVEHVTKRYGRVTAVDDISFEVAEGEIVGILGPNGAGKTTTMQMLTTYTTATGGRLTVGGRDVFRDPVGVRAQIGYLPENVPLYTDMRVTEYLLFRARLRGLGGRRLRARLAEVLAECELETVARRLISTLSRGFRQRVGLADCLVHEPPVLVLDEPTDGLDPNQIRQVRNLIRGLARRHTVLMASHILPEVEAVCDRVLIMNRGRLVASDSPGNLVGLLRGNRRVLAEVAGATRELLERRLGALPAVLRVSVSVDGDWLTATCEGEKHRDLREEIYQVASSNGWRLRALYEERRNLEDVFVEMTGTGR